MSIDTSSFFADNDPAFAVVSGSLSKALRKPLTPPAYANCITCTHYIGRRFRVLSPHMMRAAMRDGVTLRRVVHRFLLGVHARHEKGLPL